MVYESRGEQNLHFGALVVLATYIIKQQLSPSQFFSLIYVGMPHPPL